MLVVSCMNACWETVPTGRFQHPGCLRYPLTPAAAVVLQGTPVKLSQGCGGVEGTNTLKHKENTHKHPHIHTLTHTQERQQQQPPTLHRLQGKNPWFSPYRFNHIPQRIPTPSGSEPPPPATHTHARLYFFWSKVLIEQERDALLEV